MHVLDPSAYFDRSNLELHRQTGRTTRLMEDAKKLVAMGKHVYVVVHSTMLETLKQHYVEVENLEFVTLNHPVMEYFNWTVMELRLRPENDVVLLDADAIQEKYGHILNAFHAYDISHVSALDIFDQCDTYFPDSPDHDNHSKPNIKVNFHTGVATVKLDDHYTKKELLAMAALMAKAELGGL